MESDKDEAIRLEAEGAKRFYMQMDLAGEKSAAEYSYFNAAKQARIGVEQDGLKPHWEDYDWHYTLEQGAKAACLAREDVIAISYIQRDILKRLDRNKNFMWAIIVLLLYIASRLG